MSHEIQTPDLLELERSVIGDWIPRRETAPMVRGEGCWLWDAAGDCYLDLTSAYGTAPLGHCHPAIARALAEQSTRLIACSTNLYCEARARGLEALASVLPARLERMFLCNSGTEAVEAGIKLARLKTGRTGIVGLRDSFHGRTTGALAVTWSPKARTPFEPLLPGAVFPERNELAALDAVIDDHTAVVLVEVIQGESGVNPISSELLLGIERLCRERGALLLVDEIQTGFGRTGEWFAHTAIGLRPDLVTLAKGIAGGFPMGALAYTPDVGQALFPGAHGSTFGGNPLACAAARATVETLRSEDLPRRAAEMGARLLDGLRAATSGRTIVREIRGRGLMIGIELRERAGRYLAALTSEHRVLALPGGPNVVRLLPALTIEEEQVELAVAAIERVLPR